MFFIESCASLVEVEVCVSVCVCQEVHRGGQIKEIGSLGSV